MSFDMIKRIFDYRRDIDNYNSYGLKKKKNGNQSQSSISSVDEKENSAK